MGVISIGRAEKGLSLTEAAKLTNCNEEVLEQTEIGAIDLDKELLCEDARLDIANLLFTARADILVPFPV